MTKKLFYIANDIKNEIVFVEGQIELLKKLQTIQGNGLGEVRLNAFLKIYNVPAAFESNDNLLKISPSVYDSLIPSLLADYSQQLFELEREFEQL